MGQFFKRKWEGLIVTPVPIDQAYGAVVSSGMPPDDFINTNMDVCRLVLPAGPLRKVVGAAGDAKLSTLSSDVTCLIESSALGRRLFVSLSRKMVAQQVQEVIDKHIKELQAKDTIESISLLPWERGVREEIESLACIDMLPVKRDVQLRFHEVEFPYGVCSVSQHVEVSVRTVLRAWAVHQGALDPLPGEVELFGAADMTGVRCRVGADLLRKPQTARKFLNTLVLAEDTAPDGERIMVPTFFPFSVSDLVDQIC